MRNKPTSHVSIEFKVGDLVWLNIWDFKMFMMLMN